MNQIPAFVSRLRQKLDLPQGEATLRSLGRDLATALDQDRFRGADLILGAAEAGQELLHPDRSQVGAMFPQARGPEVAQALSGLHERLGNLVVGKQIAVADQPGPGAAHLEPGKLLVFRGLLQLQRFYGAVGGGLPALAASAFPLPIGGQRESRLAEGYRQQLQSGESWRSGPQDMVDFAVLHELAHEHFNDLGAEEGVMLLQQALDTAPYSDRAAERLQDGTATWLEFRQRQELRADDWAAAKLADLRQDPRAPFRGFWLLSQANQACLETYGTQKPPTDPHPDDAVRLGRLSQLARDWQPPH